MDSIADMMLLLAKLTDFIHVVTSSSVVRGWEVGIGVDIMYIITGE